MHDSSGRDSWHDFIEEGVYADDVVPWRADPAYPVILEHPGLRDGIGGSVAPALQQSIGLVRAVRGIDLLAIAATRPPAVGLCLGFGSNLSEPYDILKTCRLDRVHAYDWIGPHVVEAAQAFDALRRTEPALAAQLRLHHGTVGNLGALEDASVHIIYTANVFTREIPMSDETFELAIDEIVRVLAPDGWLVSRGSAGRLEVGLKRRLLVLFDNPLVSVLQQPSSSS